MRIAAVHPSRLDLRAVTLLEVLAAIFIMGLGLLALLSLFSIGALSMAQTIKDDRESQLHDVADDLRLEAVRIEGSAGQIRAVYLVSGRKLPYFSDSISC